MEREVELIFPLGCKYLIYPKGEDLKSFNSSWKANSTILCQRTHHCFHSTVPLIGSIIHFIGSIALLSINFIVHSSTSTNMKVLSLFTTTTVILSTIGISSAADDKYVYGKDPKKDAEYDISMGMAGIQQASKDPKLLAQLMQDMQVSFECDGYILYVCCGM